NSNYIILPKENIRNDKLQQPVQFALDNFPKVYEDSNYIVLAVPFIVPPVSSMNGLALIYKPEGMLLSSLISDEKVIQFDNRSFNSIKESGIVNLQNKDHETLTIYNGDKRSTVWSNLLQQEQIYY